LEARGKNQVLFIWENGKNKMRKLGNPGANQYIKRVSFIAVIRNNILKEKSEKFCSKIHFLRGMEYVF